METNDSCIAWVARADAVTAHLAAMQMIGSDGEHLSGLILLNSGLYDQTEDAAARLAETAGRIVRRFSSAKLSSRRFSLATDRGVMK